MKVWKRLSAVLLAVAVALGMLTACGDSATLMTRDPHVFAQWTLECAKAEGVELVEDKDLSDGYAQILEYNKQIFDINFNGTEGSILDITHQRQEVEARTIDGKNFTTIEYILPQATGMMDQISFKAEMAKWMKMYIHTLGFTPKRVGAVVRVPPMYKDATPYEELLIIIMD